MGNSELKREVGGCCILLLFFTCHGAHCGKALADGVFKSNISSKNDMLLGLRRGDSRIETNQRFIKETNYLWTEGYGSGRDGSRNLGQGWDGMRDVKVTQLNKI